MFERFTAEARQTVVLAQGEARTLHHDRVGTEHLLLALADGAPGPAAGVLHRHGLDPADLRRRIVAALDGGALDQDALATLGIDLDQVRQAAEATFGPGALQNPARRPARRSGHIPFTGPARKVLELALREAVRLGHREIGTGHLLLGLLREGGGVAADVLTEAGADLPGIREDVVRLIAAEAA
ncbi:Clp protease N-terminal domain-containing protein [Peterkaempfera griseoplana]|uniref:Clp protease N-terminal domain-containing protein n=1 Tax=Peterkaempfera griseoplana TaxID=66896 RepID=UPI0006E1F199|nr:Clp protease N-terminal domain-containing protein [Peterkaempfera griseoplana]